MALDAVAWKWEVPSYSVNGESYQSITTQLMFDCKNLAAATVTRTHHAERFAAGEKRVVENREPQEARLALADLTDPAIKALQELACQQAKKLRAD